MNQFKYYFLSCLLFCTHALGTGFLNYSGGDVKFEPAAYMEPNERWTDLAEPIWASSSPGIYMSVGTERSFIGAAVSNATHLLMMNYSI